MNYAIYPNKTGGTARNIIVRNSKGRGIAVAGQSNVVVDGFYIDGTASSGVIVLNDTSFNTRVPDNVRIANGVIKNAETVAPVDSNRDGILCAEAAGCSFANIEVIAPTTFGFRSQTSTRVTASNIRVRDNGQSDGFNIYQTSQVELSDCHAENIKGYGFFFGQTPSVVADNLTAINVSKSSALHRAIWFENGARILASDLKVIDTQNPATGYIVGAYQDTAYTQRGVLHGVLYRIENGAFSLQHGSTKLNTQDVLTSVP